jgi:hypothetical protein
LAALFIGVATLEWALGVHACPTWYAANNEPENGQREAADG